MEENKCLMVGKYNFMNVPKGFTGNYVTNVFKRKLLVREKTGTVVSAGSRFFPLSFNLFDRNLNILVNHALYFGFVI